MPTIEQIRAVASKHYDPKKLSAAYGELVRDIAALCGMKVDDEVFQLSAEKEKGPVIPPQLDTPAFRVLWAKWIADRKKARRSITTETLNHHLELLMQCDPDKAIECLEVSAYAGHMTIYNTRYKRNDRSNQGGFVPNSVEAAAKRSTEGFFG